MSFMATYVRYRFSLRARNTLLSLFRSFFLSSSQRLPLFPMPSLFYTLREVAEHVCAVEFVIGGSGRDTGRTVGECVGIRAVSAKERGGQRRDGGVRGRNGDATSVHSSRRHKGKLLFRSPENQSPVYFTSTEHTSLSLSLSLFRSHSLFHTQMWPDMRMQSLSSFFSFAICVCD